MDFQKQLLAVGKALRKDEVKALAFLCTDLLGRNPNSVESTSDLFSRLSDQDHLSAERPHLLTELLLIIQRTRLVRDLQLSDQVSTNRSLISPYRKLLYNLSEEITDDDLRDVKFLLVTKLPRRKLEKNVTTLEVFLAMEHMDLISDTDLNLLENIIQQVCPMLKEKINQFKTRQVRHTGPITQETGRSRSLSYPLEPNQFCQPSDRERTLSCEIPELRSLAECTMNSSNTSVDFPNGLHGGDECQALSLGLSGLSIETSICTSSKVSSDAMKLSPSQEIETSSEKQTSQTTNTDTEVLGTYPMTAAKRGICLIVNNCDFTNSKQGLQERKGTMVDEDCLHKVFKWLGFEIAIERNCKREKMLSVLRELGSRDHSQMDCLVCCVLSHGQEGSVFGVDGHTVQLKELTEPVNGLNCSSLAEKPKLFFIQACQGTSEQKAVYIETDGHERSDVCSDAIKAKDSIPSDADFLMGMSTIPSFVSFRERKNGTWFIQSLCQNLVEMVPSGCDLVSILTKVNADVSQKTDSTGVKKQMPQPAFSLRKKVVFPIPEAPPPSLSR
ncbi:caspase-8 [Siniperca chuatsi]|uniref:caspase-8 n=1 Tax=Siniperca chuatsi TaxID=119488 RepID=UPI001CE1A31E|nr:caspase-8 [Siniperca chuatsi]